MTPEFKLSSGENSKKDIKKRSSTNQIKIGVKKDGGAKFTLKKWILMFN